MRSVSREHRRGASRVASLNQSAIPAMQIARDELESWYVRFPDNNGQLRSSFRKRDSNHDGAFFELFLHELFARLGLSVAVQPLLEDGGRPDFLVSGRGGRAYVEATYLRQSGSLPPLEATVLNAIDDLDGQIPADLGLYVRSTGALNQTPKLRPITQCVCQWLNGLDRQGVNWGKRHTLDVPVDPKYGDWVLLLEAIPRLEGNRVTNGLGVGGARRSLGRAD